MRIDTSHRQSVCSFEELDYHVLADSCVASCGAIPGVEAIVVCGSLAKGDLVPGWSDLDLIVGLTGEPGDVAVLDELSHAIHDARGRIQIGIGLDVVYLEEFSRTRRLGGRPLMMTYEVANYGDLRFGSNLFQDIEFDTAAAKAVHAEREALIAAELHSWRRSYVSMAKERRALSPAWLFNCAKSLLRILQCETGPNLVTPLSYRIVAQRLRQRNPFQRALDAFDLAVCVRERWREFYDSVDPLILGTLETSLSSYRFGETA